MRGLNHIKIAGREYPIKCDNLVLEEIQDAFGTVQAFEEKLIGLELICDVNGEAEVSTNGEAQYRRVEPSIKAINFALPIMINEGLEIEATDLGKTYTPVEKRKLLQDIDISYRELSNIIHEEFKKCFKTRKKA